MTRRPLVAAGALVAAVAFIVVALRAVLRLPAIPYNVSELFLDHGHPIALMFFALALLWIGAGAMLIAHAVRRSRPPYLVLPVALVLVSLLSKMLVSRAVTYESLDDVLGSNNLFGLVVQHTVWGESWRRLFLALGPNAVDFLERRVRYCALYSIPVLYIAIGLIFTSARRDDNAPGTFRTVAQLVAIAAAWTWLSGAIVLAWAATDNLTELIAGRGPFGMPGSLCILGVIAVGAGNVAMVHGVAKRKDGWTGALLWSLVAVLCSWVLLTAGLDPRVEKYGATFSGVQFLLGPDRRHPLTTTVLFARWAAVYFALVAVAAFGAWVAAAFVTNLPLTSRSRSAVPGASSQHPDSPGRGPL